MSMIFTSLVLPSPDPSRLASFYRDTLGLATSRAADGVVDVQVGHSRVRLVAGPASPGSHHVAFTIPLSKFAAAKSWLAARAELLSREGHDEFPFDPPFGPARSVYFEDPDGSVLELIARPQPSAPGRLDPDLDRDDHLDRFDPVHDITGIGEIAVPVTSVPEEVGQLSREWGLPAVLEGEDFAAVGDAHAMFILVTPDRVWFPTEHRWPNLTPLEIGVTLEGLGEPAPVRFSNQTVARVRPFDR